MKLVRMRCTSCGSLHSFFNQELDACRLKVCERCGIKLTVTSSEGQVDPAPVGPMRERRILTARETHEARRLLGPALEGLEV